MVFGGRRVVKFFAIDNIELLDLDKLVKLLPGGRSWNPFSTRGRYIGAILRSYEALNANDVNTALRLAHFLGQGLIETGFLRYSVESLNYSADALRRTWPSRFTEEEAKKYARKQKEIAERVYGGRLGNGPEGSGDGWRYRGRGFFQLTGRENYKRFAEMSGVDLEGDPDILERDLKTSVAVAAAYWRSKNLGSYADQNNARAVSRGVNRGDPDHARAAHGEAERVAWTKAVLDLVKNPDTVVDDGTLDLGDRGPAVKKLQIALNMLGFEAGKPDGVYGRKTARAVSAFQVEAGVTATGRADPETLKAIEQALEDNRGNPDALGAAGLELPPPA